MLFRLNPSARPIKFIAHKNTINEVTISPLGHLIASCSDDSTIKLWKNNIHGFSHLIKIHNAPVKSVNFSSSGKLLISGGKDKKIKIYSISENKIISSLNNKYNINSVKMSPNGCLIASADEKSAKIWDINKKILINNYLNEHSGNINCVKWSPDSIYFASGSKDHKIKLYDIRTKKPIQSIDAHSNSVTSIDFHPSKKYLVSCSLDSTIKIWDLFRNAILYTLYGHEGPIYSVNFSKSGEFICSGGIDGDVYLWRNNLEGNLLEKNEKINGGLAYPDINRNKSKNKYKVNYRCKSSNKPKIRINKKCLNNEDYPSNLDKENKNINSKKSLEIASTNIDSKEISNMKNINKNKKKEINLSPEISKKFNEMIYKLDLADKVIQSMSQRMNYLEKQLYDINGNKTNKENDDNLANLNEAINYYNNVIKKNENDNPVEIFEDVNNHVEDIRQEVLGNKDYKLK